MRPILRCAATRLLLATPVAATAEVVGEAVFFCYWIDAAHKQAATTGVFRAAIAEADAIAGKFAKEMQLTAKSRKRVYDCGWRRVPEHAQQDRQSLRAAHASKGFTLSDIDWDPHTLER
jgi:hypothetical protein